MPWRCSRCETINPDDLAVCDVCDGNQALEALHPAPEVISLAETVSEDATKTRTRRASPKGRLITPHIHIARSRAPHAPRFRHRSDSYSRPIRYLLLCVGVSLFTALLIVVLHSRTTVPPVADGGSRLPEPHAIQTVAASNKESQSAQPIDPATTEGMRFVHRRIEIENHHDMVSLKQLYASDFGYNGQPTFAEQALQDKASFFKYWSHTHDEMTGEPKIRRSPEGLWYIDFTTNSEMKHDNVWRGCTRKWKLEITTPLGGPHTVLGESVKITDERVGAASARNSRL